MVGIGIVGIGFMGMIHYLAAQKARGGRVIAICSRDPKKLAGDWTGIRGNFGPSGTQMDLSDVARHADFEAMIADPAVDLVDLCVPSDDHARLAIRALEAGKHVLVEKPIALSTDEADRMIAAAGAAGRLLMVAHVLPFFPEFAYADEAVRSGKHGAMLAANFARVISRPDWSQGIADAGRSGGPAVDLHIHDTHFVGLACGVPAAVSSRGVIRSGAVVHVATQYIYEGGGPVVAAVSGALSQSGRPFMHGFEIFLERATLVFESGGPVSKPLSLILPDGAIEQPTLGSTDPVDAFADEVAAAAASVEAGTAAPALSAGLARSALRTCWAEVESVETGLVVAIE